MTQKYEVGQKVEAKVERFTPIGVIVSFNKDEGLVYKSDLFEDVQIGQKSIAYIKEIREDGKIDVTFRRYGYKDFIGTATERILQKLKESKGTLSLNDKSSPKDITDTLGMSKTQFKQAIGNLYKAQKILITDKGITLK
jgi:predicted RNA-binding protein (virulence factor B family)